MTDLFLNKHISNQFNDELDALVNHVLAMGGLVEQQLKDALQAVENRDLDLAQKVLESDYRINAMEVSIDEECTQIIAMRQPAASDLRLILAIAKTVADLERIGDEVERLARVALESFNSGQHDFMSSLEVMGHQCISMLHGTLDAFARMDVDAAFRIHKDDLKVDRQYDGLTRQLMTYMMEDPRAIPKVMNVLWSARGLERIGDRCQNICEYIIYFVKGRDVRHVSRDIIAKDVLGRE